MAQESPAVILYDENSKPLAVQDGVAIPVATPRLLVAGKDASNNAKTLLTDPVGRMVASPPGSVSLLRGFSFGFTVQATPGNYAVRSTTYTEQTSNAQRSIASSSANDSAAGTGARTIKITYYDQTMDGPFTETVTLNGTSYVNTVATNICFIEKMEVQTVGSGGTNAGTLTLKAATAGGGATIWTVAVGEGRTNGAHHYVQKSRKCYITGMYGGIKGANPGAVYIKALNPLVANSNDLQISDLLRLVGNGSFLRSYGTAIEVTGPSRIVAWTGADSSVSTTYYASFDFYEEAA